ncbi:amino acid ABC transporter ATP-binding protein [Clostridium frigidicarnis]|uniref:Amino acid ABC transporter ATP-binding protein, PAAT family n=1 Tax=Clostridium frigidicarnis TaxID=84698 RepID=A0A1I0V7L5_9CLOT|nr:amino acid ABC transporter ATP-binding protein [Clostridium frigidicarnis]SFA72050.1 amino acid ABC transporter ATP-binding protein, PAAT family [Clostridium frigidicarnis]
MLQVVDIKKSFKGIKVLENITFNINRGEIVSLIGESGAGKTTTMRIISGLEKVDSGHVLIDSEELNKDTRKNLGMVFQGFNLFPHMTVLQNIIEAPINVLKIDKYEAEKRAFQILKSLAIEDKAKNYPCELSGGQKQRVAIARVLAMKPKYICFDEPTSALDPKLTLEVGEIIKELSKEGIGILIVTHDMIFAKKVSSRIIEINNGRILRNVSSEEFFNIIV